MKDQNELIDCANSLAQEGDSAACGISIYERVGKGAAIDVYLNHDSSDRILRGRFYPFETYKDALDFILNHVGAGVLPIKLYPGNHVVYDVVGNAVQSGLTRLRTRDALNKVRSEKGSLTCINGRIERHRKKLEQLRATARWITTGSTSSGTDLTEVQYRGDEGYSDLQVVEQDLIAEVMQYGGHLNIAPDGIRLSLKHPDGDEEFLDTQRYVTGFTSYCDAYTRLNGLVGAEVKCYPYFKGIEAISFCPQPDQLSELLRRAIEHAKLQLRSMKSEAKKLALAEQMLAEFHSTNDGAFWRTS